MFEKRTNIKDIRHAEKPSNIEPDSITPNEIQQYKEAHNLDPRINDDIIKQIIIINRGGSVYGQKNWDSKLNPEDKTTITYEGIRASHDFANKIFEEAVQSERSSIYLFVSGPAGRTMETQAVVHDRIEQLSKRDKTHNTEVILAESAREIFNTELPDKKSVFAFQAQGEQNLEPVNNPTIDMVGKFFKDDAVNEMLWYAKPDEVEKIKQEIILKTPESEKLINSIKPADYRIPPEEVVIRILNFYKKLIELTKDVSGRDVYIICTSHNMTLDATTISLLGKEISAQSVKELGAKAREPLEGSQISISGNTLTVMHRGNKHCVGINELEQLIDSLEDKLKERKKDWGVA